MLATSRMLVATVARSTHAARQRDGDRGARGARRLGGALSERIRHEPEGVTPGAHVVARASRKALPGAALARLK